MAAKLSYLEQVIGENPEAVLAIREVPHFRECSDNLLRLIYKYGRIFSLQANEELTRENEFDQWVFFILGGRLAVYVGDELVDTITSTMVGERCILGEPRGATLRAADDGITALGIDMALLDALRERQGQGAESAAVLIELLSIIATEIVRRVANLSYAHYDISGKYEKNRGLEQSTDLIEKIKTNSFQNDPYTNLEIYKYLHRVDKWMLALCTAGETPVVDTRKLYALGINSGRHDLIGGMIAKLSERNGAPSPPAGEEDPQIRTFSFVDFCLRALRALNAERGRGGAENDPKPIPMEAWRERFRLDDSLKVDLKGICGWLKRALGYSDVELVQALMLILKEGSEYTAQINDSIKAMVSELSRISFITKLESAAPATEASLWEYLDRKKPEELIPLISQHVLGVHLVKPFLDGLERLGNTTAGEGSGNPELTGQSQIDSLFD